ncbi:hypothetical protein Tco_0363688, partial [Tanacetum coccineum]
PPYVRYVVSSDSSHHSASYSEAASLVRSPAVDVPVVTVAITTTVDANIVAGAKAKDAPKDFEHIGDYASAGGVDADAASISKSKKPSISLDSFYASQSLDTETMHHVYVPRWKVTNDSVLDDPDVCRDMTDRLAPPALFTQLRKVSLRTSVLNRLFSFQKKDAEIAHLKSLLSLKEAEAAEAISLRRQLSKLEAADAAKSTELRDLKENNFALEGERNVATLTADLSGFQLSRVELNSKLACLESKRDCLATQKSSLESAFEFLKEQVEKMQDEQVGVLSERVAAIDSDLVDMVLYMDAEFYPSYLTTIAGQRWILNRGLKLVLAKCLSSPEYLSAIGEAIEIDYVAAVNALQCVSFSLLAQLEANKDASMADVMDLLCLEGPAAETSEASQLQPSLDQLMIPIHRLEDQVIIGETSLAFSLEVAHNRVQRLRGEPSAFADLTTDVTTALSTTFVQTDPVPTVLSTEDPPHPKIVFEDEELDTMLEHVLAPCLHFMHIAFLKVADIPCSRKGISIAVSKLVCSFGQRFHDFVWSFPLRSELAPVFRVACFVVPVN